MRHLSVALLLAVSACKKAPVEVDPVQVKEVIAGVGLIDYDSAKGTFTCRAPGEWKALEHPDRHGIDTVSFFGPLHGPRPTSVTIGVMRFPIGDEGNKGPEAYAESFWEFTPDAKPPKRETVEMGGKKVIRFAIEKPYVPIHARKAEYIERWDFALVPVKGGFFRIQHKAPKDEYLKTLPIFEAVVRSFKPKES
jgi:hypothetical protein